MNDANQPLTLITGTADALLEFEVVSARLGGLGKTRIDELEKTDPNFPKRIPIGQVRANGRPARVAWLESEVTAYVRELVAKARSKDQNHAGA
ncbi:helix-turn-helix transcriptional regulator [Pseudomonas mandelii]|uniref:helix-turn-helix transcriptional regulator n=1 Tax=Pseudomonas mandelii TaxID=75612 RepID=UPI003C71D95A